MNKHALNTMKERVKAILEMSVKSRNFDASLVANYWYRNKKIWLKVIRPDNVTCDVIEKPEWATLPLINLESVTQPSVIERARRLVQEEAVMSGNITEMGKCLPTDPKILKQRRINCKAWKDIINKNKIEFILNYGKETS